MSDLRSEPRPAGDAVRGIPLGSWAGIPVRAGWSALLILALFAWTLAGSALPSAVGGRSALSYWIVGTATAIVFFGTLLGHEFAHALVARHFGLNVRGLTLWALGGYTELRDEPATPRADGWVAASGPLTSIGLGLLAGAAGLALRPGSMTGAALSWLGGVNLLLGLLNLLPGAPLDGGRVLRALLWWRWHDRARATRASVRAGRFLGLSFVALGCLEVLLGGLSGIWLALIGWYLMAAASAQGASAGLEPVRALRAGQLMIPVPVVGPDWWTVERFVQELSPSALAQRVFPLVDVEGKASGYVTVQALGRVAEQKRAETPLRQVSGVTNGRMLSVRPDAILGDIWDELARHRGVGLVVDERGAPIGAVTELEVRRAGELTRLGWHPPLPHPA